MRVETMVAIEFAVSCRPLSRSNASATTIRPISAGRLRAVMAALRPSQLIDDDGVDFVRDVLEAVDDFFEMIVELRADNEAHRFVLRIILWAGLWAGLAIGQEQRLQSLIADVVGLFFDGDDLRGQRVEA